MEDFNFLENININETHISVFSCNTKVTNLLESKKSVTKLNVSSKYKIFTIRDIKKLIPKEVKDKNFDISKEVSIYDILNIKNKGK